MNQPRANKPKSSAMEEKMMAEEGNGGRGELLVLGY
jgi:hypothetical protein